MWSKVLGAELAEKDLRLWVFVLLIAVVFWFYVELRKIPSHVPPEKIF